MTTMLRYFAYGSNLDVDQMLRRCPNARPLGFGLLPHHRLAFAGHSTTWGGGVATLLRDPEQDVSGLVWALDPEDLATLDRCEGHPWAYQRKRLLVWLNGRRRQAQVYIKPKPQLTRPSPLYLRVIHDAYTLYGFDAAPLLQAAEGPQATEEAA